MSIGWLHGWSLALSHPVIILITMRFQQMGITDTAVSCVTSADVFESLEVFLKLQDWNPV